MKNLERMMNDKMARDPDTAFLSFGLRISFVIRHPSFVIASS
jgi:hypothetical protein